MSLEDGNDLHPLTSDILAAVLSATGSASVSVEEARDGDLEDLLARFACGWVTDEERMSVIEVLSESEDRRLRLIQMRDSLKSAAKDLLPVDDPVLVKTLASSVRALINVYSRWKEVCARLLTAGPSSLDESRSIQAAMRRIEAGWRLLPVGMSLTRGENAIGTVTIQPGNTRAELFVQIDPLGGAIVSAELSSHFEPAKEFALFVVGPDGDWIFLGAENTDGSHWQLTLTGIADILGTRATDLQPSWLALTESPYLPTREAVRLERSIGGVDSSIWLTMTQPPAILAEEFSVGILLPEAVRADLTDGAIVALVEIGPLRYPIGRWSVKGLPAFPQVILKVPLEGVADGDIELQSAIRLSFVSADLHE